MPEEAVELPRVSELAENLSRGFFPNGICKGIISNIPKETERTQASPLEFNAKIQKKSEKIHACTKIASQNSSC